MLALEAGTPAEAVEQAVANAVSGGRVVAQRPWEGADAVGQPEPESDQGAVADEQSAAVPSAATPSGDGGPFAGGLFGWNPFAFGGLLVAAVLLVGLLGGLLLPGNDYGYNPLQQNVSSSSSFVAPSSPSLVIPSSNQPPSPAATSPPSTSSAPTADGIEGVASALQLFGFSEQQAQELADRAMAITPQQYRFADDVGNANTIDFPWTTVTSFGAAEVQFDDFSFMGDASFPCNQQIGDDHLAFCADGGPRSGVPYLAMYTTFAGDFPVMDTGGLAVNFSWPTNIEGMPGWEPIPAYAAGDTWQGASRIPYLTYGPEPWALAVSQLSDGMLADDPNSGAFGLLGGDTLILFAPTDELMQGTSDPSQLRYGFALHVHDGTFGACETCGSIVTAIPPVPRTQLLGYGDMPLMVVGPGGSGPPPSGPSIVSVVPVGPITATFFPDQQMTEYHVEAPDSFLSVEWSGADCGEFGANSAEPRIFNWAHPHPPCDEATNHIDRTVVVSLTTDNGEYRCTYQGTGSGTGEPCTLVAGALSVSSPSDSPSSATSGSSSDSSSGSSSGFSSSSSSQSSNDGNGSLAAILLGGLGAVAIGGGLYRVFTPTANGGGLAQSPTSTAGPTERDEEIISALRDRVASGGPGALFTDTDAPPAIVSVSPDANWQTSVLAEQLAQERLVSEFSRLLDQINAAWAEYRSALDRFRSRYTLLMSGSLEMQALLTTWAETRVIAQRQDLAFAIVTLLWSGGSLALKGARWVKGGRTAGAAGGEATAAGAEVATYASDTPSFFKYMDMLEAKKAAGMEALAAEAGLDMAELAVRYGDDAELIHQAVLNGAARARGWIAMAPEAEATVGRLLVNGRAALAGRGTLAAEDVALLQQWAQRPGFWDRLAKAAGHMDEVGWIGDHADVHQFIGLFYQADDIAFLRALAESGGDMTRLGRALGPAQAAALTSLDGALANVVANAPTTLAPGAAVTAAQNAMSSDPVSQLGDLGNFVDQFGVTNEFHDSNAAEILGGELWSLISSPFETYQRHKFTHEALSVYETFLENHGDHLGDMSHALDDGYRALERLERALRLGGVGDQSGPLHRRMEDLRGVLSGMQEQYDGASPEWHEAHDEEFNERKAHIEEKLRYVSAVSDQFDQMRTKLPLMMQWLGSLRNPEGGNRSPLAMMDPELGVRMMSIGAFLDGSLAGAYRTSVPSPGTGATTAPASALTESDDDVFDEYEAPSDPDPAVSDEEIDAAWEQQMQDLDTKWDDFDAIPEDYELDVDLPGLDDE